MRPTALSENEKVRGAEPAFCVGCVNAGCVVGGGLSIAVSCDNFDDLRTLAAVVKPAAGLEAVRFIGVVGVVGQQKLGQQRGGGRA